MESREEVTARIKEAADIVQVIGETVELRKSGARYLGLCPFHGEKTPSFTVHPGNQFFYCFGCGESGDVFSYMMKYHNLDFPEAVKQLAARYNIALPEKRVSEVEKQRQQLKKNMFAVNGKGAGIFSNCLENSPLGEGARRYLVSRGIPLEIQKQFGLGYAPSHQSAGWNFLGGQFSKEERIAAIETGLLTKKEDGSTYDRFRDRVLFPIFDISGQVCGFGGRIIGDGQPKYMNSPESAVYNKSKSLLGLYQLKDAIRKKDQVILVEGNFDLISLVAKGVENVVAPLGTALTREQVRLLKRFASEGVLLFDGDNAGIKAAVRSVPFFLAEQMKGKVVLLPEKHDPDTYVQEYGTTALLELIDGAQELSEFVLTQLVQEHGLSLEGKTRIVEELKPIVQAASSSLQRSVVIGHFAEKLSVSPEELQRLLKGQMPQVLEAPPVPVPPRTHVVKIGVSDRVTPLTPPQKRLVSFMVLYPGRIQEMQDAGLREYLAGSMGEILLLQLGELVSKGDDVQPEDLLSTLPEGPERTLVSEILLSAPDSDLNDEQAGENDCLYFLRQVSLKKESENVLKRIVDAQNQGDFKQLQELLGQKQAIDQKMRDLQGK